MPPSEQDDVLTVTRKLKNMTPVEAAKVEITEDELRNFSRVYPRLYQVARKNHNRLTEWGNRHQREVRAWDLGGFFTAREDEEEDFVLRKPGCPEGAIEKLRHQREQEAAERESDEQQPQQQQKPSVRRSGRARVAADLERQAKQKDLPVQAAAPAASDNQDAWRARKNNKNSVEELEFLQGGMKKVVSRLEGLSEGADHDDPYKGELASIAQQVSNFLGALNQVKEDIVEQLKRRAQGRFDGGKKRALEAEDGAEEENEKQKKQRHKAARLRAIAGLSKEDDPPAQDNEMPPRAPRVEADTPMAQDGDNNSTVGTSIAAALPRREGSIVTFPMRSVAHKATVEEPKFQVEAPKTRVKEPRARADKPKAHAENPKARAEEPKSRVKEPKARAGKPKTRAEASKARVEEPKMPEEQGTTQKEEEEDPKARTQPANDDTDEDDHGVI